MLSIGLMSGTSMDGIDAALIETDGSWNLLKEAGNIAISYDPSFKIILKAAEFTIRKCRGVMTQAQEYFPQGIKDYLQQELNMPEMIVDSKIAELSSYLTLSLPAVIQHSSYLHALAVKKLLKKTGFKPQQIDVVGYHGQTMLHCPSIPLSIIVGDGQFLADQIGITVVNDFRSHDIACGGQGAPFAPLYHQALAIRDDKMPLAVLNCGGIANITLISNSNERDLIAFDTGPGNGLIDKLVRLHTKGKEHMDANGKYGKQGRVNKAVLNALYEKAIIKDGQNFFMMTPPKSLDIGDMTLIPELFSLSIEDACRTLEAFTADTIINSLEFVTIPLPQCWVLAGGGWNNPVIRQELERRLKHKIGTTVTMVTADEMGWNSQAMEAQLFAYLAVRSLQNKPLSLPGTTQVSQPVSGGRAYIPHTGPTQVVKGLLEKNSCVLLGYQETRV